MAFVRRVRERAVAASFALALAGASAGAAPGLAPGPEDAAPPVMAGGALTLPLRNRDAFARPAPFLDAAGLRAFQFGNRVFNTNWTVAPSSAEGFDGLGPTFNRVSCSGCHVRDGRGRPPRAGERGFESMLFRVSVPGTDAHGGPAPHPSYGDQLQDRAIPGVEPEVRLTLTWEERPGRYADGTPYTLRTPRLRIHDPAFGALGAEAMLSPRVAPAVIGMGLLDAVPEAALLAREDADDRDGDGVSGRANRVFDPAQGRMAIGRYGWKANVASLLQQSAGAAHGDIGLTSRWFPQENCPAPQTACRRAIDGGRPELRDDFAHKLVHYLETLAVPARRDADAPAVRRGEALFTGIGCASCHVPVLETGTATAQPALANQRFAPYTDLLLHDLGEGLADGRPDYVADGREWRTAPLWGLGLLEAVNGHLLLLHDGRARGFAEAILWHGGEAQSARERFRALSAADRDALVAFLGSL